MDWGKSVIRDLGKLFVICLVTSVVIAVIGVVTIRELSLRKFNAAYYMRCLGECAPYEPTASRTSFCVCDLTRAVPMALPTIPGEPE